jgi:hypothetical protein
MDSLNKLKLYSNDIRIKNKNDKTLNNLIKFKYYRRKCKDYLDLINILLKKLQNNKINDELIITKLMINSYKLKLSILHMAFYFNSLTLNF